MFATMKPGSDPLQGQPPRARRWIPLSLRMFVTILVGPKSNLRKLSLHDTAVTDAGIAELNRSLPALQISQ